MVKVVSEKVSTCVATMAIENGEKRALGPSLAGLLNWLLDVQNNRHPVFIVAPDNSLVGVRCVRFDDTYLFD